VKPELLVLLRHQWLNQRARTLPGIAAVREAEDWHRGFETWLDEHPDQKARYEAATAQLDRVLAGGDMSPIVVGVHEAGGRPTFGGGFTLDPNAPGFREAAAIRAVGRAYERDSSTIE